MNSDSDSDAFADFASIKARSVKSEPRKKGTKTAKRKDEDERSVSSRVTGSSVATRRTASSHTARSTVCDEDSEDESRLKEDKYSGLEQEVNHGDISGDEDTASYNYTAMGSSVPGSVGIKKAAELDEVLKTEAEYKNIYRKYYPFREKSAEIFPIATKKNEIMEAIFDKPSSRVTIIKGETGCGKTTLVPLYILDHIAQNRDYRRSRMCNIWVTQPRRIAATSIARHVSQTREWRCRSEVGGLIGYKVGLDKCVSKDTRITYMTSGCALQIVRTNRSLDNITHLIIDEVHERDMDIEMVLLLAKDVLERNKNIKVIIMSATVETGVYQRYFRNFSPILVDVRSRAFPVQQYFLDDLRDDNAESVRGFTPYIVDRRTQRCIREFSSNVGVADLRDESIKTFVGLLEHIDLYEKRQKKEEKGSVLVFCPGLAEINRVFSAIKAYKKLDFANMDIYRAHSMLPRDQAEEKKMLSPPARGRRKIILSTNICESSITIPDVVYVIDFCLSKRKIRDKQTNLEQLIPIWTSEENSDQRSGRAGRTQPGFAFRLVTKKFMKEEMKRAVTPEIMISRLENFILLGKTFYPNMRPEDFIQKTCAKPKDLDVNFAVQSLKLLRALTQFPENCPPENVSVGGYTRDTLWPIKGDAEGDGDLTPLGHLMTIMPMEIEVTRMLYYAYLFGFTYEGIILAAGISQEGFWLEDTNVNLQNSENFKAKTYWACGSQSDPIAIMNAFLKWYGKMSTSYCNLDPNVRRRSRNMRPPKSWLNSNALFETVNEEVQWCKDFGINQKAVREMHVMIDEIKDRMESSGFLIGNLSDADIAQQRADMIGNLKLEELHHQIIKVIIAAGAFPHIYKMKEKNHHNLQEMKLTNSQILNPLNTIHFVCPPEVEARAVAKHIKCQYHSSCGYVKNVICHGNKIFIVFEADNTNTLYDYLGRVHRQMIEVHDRELRNAGDPNRKVNKAVVHALKKARAKRNGVPGHGNKDFQEFYACGDYLERREIEELEKNCGMPVVLDENNNIIRREQYYAQKEQKKENGPFKYNRDQVYSVKFMHQNGYERVLTKSDTGGGSEFRARVTWNDNLETLWVIQQGYEWIYERIQEEIEKHVKAKKRRERRGGVALKKLQFDIKDYERYLAPHRVDGHYDLQYDRCVVLQADIKKGGDKEEQAYVRFVDYGNIEYVPKKDLLEIPKTPEMEFTRSEPNLAMEIKIRGFRQIPVAPKRYLQQLVDRDSGILVNVFSTKSTKPVILADVYTLSGISFADYYVKEGFGRRIDDNFLDIEASWEWRGREKIQKSLPKKKPNPVLIEAECLEGLFVEKKGAEEEKERKKEADKTEPQKNKEKTDPADDTKKRINEEESKDSGNSTPGPVETKSDTTKETPTKKELGTDSGKGSTPIASDGASTPAKPKSEKKKNQFRWTKEVPDRPRKKPGDYKDDIDVVELEDIGERKTRFQDGTLMFGVEDTFELKREKLCIREGYPDGTTRVEGPFSSLVYEAMPVFECAQAYNIKTKASSINSVICIETPEEARQTVLLGNMVEMHRDNIQPRLTTLFSDIPECLFFLHALYSPLYHVRRSCDPKDDTAKIEKRDTNHYIHPGREGKDFEPYPFVSYVAGSGLVRRGKTDEHYERLKEAHLHQLFPEYDVQQLLKAEILEEDIDIINELRDNIDYAAGTMAKKDHRFKRMKEIEQFQKNNRRLLRQYLSIPKQTKSPVFKKLWEKNPKKPKAWPSHDRIVYRKKREEEKEKERKKQEEIDAANQTAWKPTTENAKK